MVTPVALSVLVCSVDTRWNTFAQAIQEQLWGQYNALPAADQERVEILILTDNRRMMLGQKRNVMVDAAQGEYVVFVDDDDRLTDDYLAALLAATSDGADCITFLAAVTLDGGPMRLCRYSLDYLADANTADEYHRVPNHICAVRRDLALLSSFPNVVCGEDRGYSTVLRPLLSTETHIDRVLYHYDYNSATTETQRHIPAPIRERAVPPVMDVIVLSHAKTPALQAMTQQAVTSCVAGANSLPCNVIVIEQAAEVRYKHARTIHYPGEFHYNRFANYGAQHGSAPWIMVANNDLRFRDGWLHALLAAGHPFVSPHEPNDVRQADLTTNTIGDVTGRHMSGWCFAIRRTLWEQIGGFDEQVSFWFSDDVVIEQCRAAGVLPMLVIESAVEHLGSVTLLSEPEHLDERTWAQLAIFEQAYGPHRLSSDPRYLAWQRRQQVTA